MLSVEFLKEELVKGKSIRCIAIEKKVNYSSLARRCKRLGLVSAYANLKTKIDINVVEELYKKGKSVQSIGEIVGLSGPKVWKHLKRTKVVMRKVGSDNLKLSPDLRQDFFEKIDCEEKAYWLGMLFSDGSVVRTKKQDVIGLCLRQDDGYHVLKFRKVLKSNVKKYLDVKLKSVGVRITSTKIVDNLEDKGCIQRKSFKEIEVKGIDNFERHFWRGVFDGDGSITFSGRKRETLQVRICCSSKKLMNQYVSWVKNICGDVPEKILFKTSSVWVVQLYSKNAECVLDEFYKDSSVWLYRKRKIFEEYKRNDKISDLKINSKKKFTGEFYIEEVSLDEVKSFIMMNHYSNKFPAVTRKVIAAKRKGSEELLGVITLGLGVYPKHTIRKLFLSMDVSEYLEIGKMCFKEGIGKGFGSLFLSKVRKWVKVNYSDVKVIYTWADGFMGKAGYVYQAASYLYGGFIWTDRYVSEDGEVIHPKATRKLCQEEEKESGKKVYWLSEDFQKRNGLRRYKGLQFRYVQFVCDKLERKNLIKESLIVLNKDYPKEDDLKWKVQKNGSFVLCSSPLKK